MAVEESVHRIGDLKAAFLDRARQL